MFELDSQRSKNIRVLSKGNRQRVSLAAAVAYDADEAKAALNAAAKTIDKAASNNTIHENAAARKKSTLAKKVNAMA